MDPIEKLLSDLAPTRAPGDLDQTMTRIFNRAERKSRLRRATRTLAAMSTMLVIGLGAGYRWGESASPQEPIDLADRVSAMNTIESGFLDFSAPRNEVLDGELRFSVNVLPASETPGLESKKGV